MFDNSALRMFVDYLPTLFGLWPFTYAGMLGWAAAAAIPIAIHLLSRRRYRETSWAAMQFLLAAAKKHARRLRIEQLILLVLRVLVLVLLAIALADPSFYQRGPSAARARGGHTHWVLVLDGSYSMDYRAADATLFAQAQDAARNIISSAEQGDGFTLVLMGEPPLAAIREPVFDTSDVIRELDGLTTRHAGADLMATLREVKDIVDMTSRRQPRLKETHICIYSDMGQTTWEAAESESCRRLINELAELSELHLIELGDNNWQNAAVTRLDAAHGTAIVDRQIQLTAQVRRFSTSAPQQVRAEWVIDDQVMKEEPLDLTSGADVLTLSHRFATPGEHRVEIRLPGADPLDVDNHRWRVLLVRESIRALCVEGAPGAARYVAAALEPRMTDRPTIRWEIANESALVDRDLSAYDCIFLCNVARFSSEEAVALRNYVRSGGGAAFFLGDQVAVDDYNEKLGPAAGDDQRILPVALGETISAELRGFDPLEYQHPLVQPFAKHERAGLLTVPTWQYIRLNISDEFRGSIALNFTNGDAALIEEKIGRGRVVLFASAATASSAAQPGESSWTDLAVWPSFLPIIQQTVAALVETTAEARHFRVGEPLMGVATPGTSEPTVEITTPAGEVERVMIGENEDGGSANEWRLDNSSRSGIYQLQFHDSERAPQYYAVNVDVAESKLDRYDPAQLPSQIRRGLADIGAKSPVERTPYAPVSYARWALTALAGLLLLETYLAWYFGSARV